MATYGALRQIEEGETQQSVTTRRNGYRENVSFHYTEPFSNHFKDRHQVDDHNNLRHSPILLEESIRTKDWKLRVFTFVLALADWGECETCHRILCKEESPNEPTWFSPNPREGALLILLNNEKGWEEQVQARFYAHDIKMWSWNCATFCRVMEWNKMGVAQKQVPTTRLSHIGLPETHKDILQMHGGELDVPHMHWYTYSIGRWQLVSEARNSVWPKNKICSPNFDLYNFLSIGALTVLPVTKL